MKKEEKTWPRMNANENELTRIDFERKQKIMIVDRSRQSERYIIFHVVFRERLRAFTRSRLYQPTIVEQDRRFPAMIAEMPRIRYVPMIFLPPLLKDIATLAVRAFEFDRHGSGLLGERYCHRSLFDPIPSWLSRGRTVKHMPTSDCRATAEVDRSLGRIRPDVFMNWTKIQKEPEPGPALSRANSAHAA